MPRIQPDEVSLHSVPVILLLSSRSSCGRLWLTPRGWRAALASRGGNGRSRKRLGFVEVIPMSCFSRLEWIPKVVQVVDGNTAASSVSAATDTFPNPPPTTFVTLAHLSIAVCDVETTTLRCTHQRIRSPNTEIPGLKVPKHTSHMNTLKVNIQ